MKPVVRIAFGYGATRASPPDHETALAALARGDNDALDRIRLALRANPDDPRLLLAEAEAEFLADDPEAGERLARLVAARPGWIPGHRQLISVRRERGEPDFARSLVDALTEQPTNAALWDAYIAVLAGAGLPLAAADAAAEARRCGFHSPMLLLIEAQHAEEAGDLSRAAALISRAPASLPERAGVEARLRLASGDAAAAVVLLEQARAQQPDDVELWSLTELAWRATGDARWSWLVRDGFVDTQPLGLDDVMLAALANLLRRLHTSRTAPLEQSVRGGTQTRGMLFDRAEPQIADLVRRLRTAVEGYIAKLAPADRRHPLLRHRDRPLRVVGGWSVRLAGGSDHHASHIHPSGIISSACYVALPLLETATSEGALELGRPPPSLNLDLGPIVTIQPVAGELVLFPSYLFHGTRPFPAGERLTVAFDVR